LQHHRANPAARTSHQIHAGECEQALDPALGCSGGGRCRAWVKQSAGLVESTEPDLSRRDESVVAYFMEAFGQNMLQQPSQKLDLRQRACAAVLGGKGDHVCIGRQDASVGDANTVRVAAQLAKDLLGAAKRLLRVHDPALVEKHDAQRGDSVCRKAKLSLLDGREQSGAEQSTE
jgi:hypothetical protein